MLQLGVAGVLGGSLRKTEYSTYIALGMIFTAVLDRY